MDQLWMTVERNWAQRLLAGGFRRLPIRYGATNGFRLPGDEGYTHLVKKVVWRPEEPAQVQAETWCKLAREPGVFLVRFLASGDGESLAWKEIEPWARSRAVTIAEIGSDLGGPGLDLALCSDLVYVHQGVELRMGLEEPTAGLLWALGRAGRPALARGLLEGGAMAAEEAVRLGLAQRVLDPGESPAVSDGVSLVALTTARDLMRSSVGSRSALELAAFRLLFSSGDPGEGARAFFDKRAPEFAD